MTSSDSLRKTLTQLGLSQVELATLLGVSPRTVNLWVTGQRAVPGPAAAYLRLFMSIPRNLQALELSLITKEQHIMRQGVYGIRFVGRSGHGSGYLMLADGRVFGVDEGRAKYDGFYGVDAAHSKVDVNVKVVFPPNAETVLGITHPHEWSIEVAGSFDPTQDLNRITAMTNLGQPIAVEITYLRDMPAAA